MNKLSMWREANKGLKSRLTNKVKDPALQREEVPDVFAKESFRRGDTLQKARLRFYPSIDVEHQRVYAGTYDGSLSELEDKLVAIGARNNPTAYVEITEENGPDDGSYSILFITETGGGPDVPRARNTPSIFRRVKDQIHLVLWKTSEGVDIGAHREQHAWLQPARHAAVNDANAGTGIRDFRDMWFDEFGEELPGKDDVKWETTH